MAKITADPTGGVTTGIDMVHYAVLEEDEKDKAPIYGEIKPLPNAKSMKFDSNDSSHTEYYDNVPKVTVVSKGEKKAAFTKSDFSDDDKADILGFKFVEDEDFGKVLVESGDSIPPYIALGFRIETSKGHRYYWALKGTMSTPSISADSKEQSAALQNQSIEGTYIVRNYDDAIVVTVHVTGSDDTDDFAEKWFSEAALTKKWKNGDNVKDI